MSKHPIILNPADVVALAESTTQEDCTAQHRTIRELSRMPCQGCGIPIPEPGENPESEALLCDACHGGD